MTPPVNDFYVYVYFRLNGSPCYVGKGRGSRWVKHKNGAGGNSHLMRIIQKSGGDLPRVKIRTQLTNEQAIEIECALIAAIGREKDGGPLVNLSKGGDGVPGHYPSQETREKLKAAHRNRDEAAKRLRSSRIAESLRGQRKSEETCAKMSAAKQAMTTEQKLQRNRKCSVAKAGKPISASHRENIRLGRLRVIAEKRASL